MDSANEKKIFKQFVYAERLSFSELGRKTKIPSNLLAYFLKKLSKKGILSKSIDGKYILADKGEKLIPFYTEHESLTPLVVLLILITDKNKILLSKRKKRPYKELFSILSGRMLLGEDIRQSVERICRQKLGVDCIFQGINAVVHERLIEGEIKHSFVFFLTRAKLIKPLENISNLPSEERVEWFSLSKLPKNKMIASDYWLIKNKLKSKIEIVEEILENKGKRLRFV